VQAFLLDQWLPAVEGRLRRSTRANYVTNLKVHVIPALGALKLQRLTAPRLAAFYSELLASGRRDGKGLAPKTVRNIHALLHRALKDAARWGYVAHNRADDVDPPHGGSPQQQVWTPEQLRAFLTHVRDDRLYALWLLVATTGMRRAELAGLRWSDMDFARARLTPRLPRVVVNYQVHESDTKTASGRRSLALDPATLEALREHRRRQAEERAIAELADDNDLVFTWPDGRPLQPRPDHRLVPAPRQAGRVGPGWTQAGRPAGDPAARRAPQLRDRGAGRRHPRQDRQRAARARQRPDHARHLWSRHPGPGRAGGGDRRTAHPGGLGPVQRASRAVVLPILLPRRATPPTPERR
jgi:integrase